MTLTLTTIKSCVKNQLELTNCLNKIHPHLAESYQECCANAFDLEKPYEDSFRIKIDYILSYLHDHLNTGQWTEVSDSKRRAFTGASFIKSLLLLKSGNNNKVQDALKCIDRGFLLGLPLEDNYNMLTQCASCLTNELKRSCEIDVNTDEEVSAKKLKQDNYEELVADCVNIVKIPALEEFYKSYFLREKPVIIQGCMSSWPACEKWADIKYLLKTAGGRTVPIEIGSSYSDENFSQQLMTLSEFIEKYYLGNSKDLGYLAQHDLLNQVPELKDDIRIPEYCCTSRNFDDDNLFEPEINAWFGPKGTVSSLHHDPKDNLLCQVFGVKQVILFAPSDSDYLYAHDAMFLNNTAQVDPIKPNLNLYPEFRKAQMFKCLLNPGEMLYIPPKWWHHITALQRSFSVNFWWQ